MKRRFMFFMIAVMLVMVVSPAIGGGTVETYAVGSANDSVYADIADYLVCSESLEDDGYIGIPVRISTYTKGSPTDMTQVITYVMNHAMPRIGTEEDTPILTDFLNDGYIVVILDYLSNEKAVSPDLDWSILNLRTQINKGAYLGSLRYRKDYNHIIPAGYRMKRDVTYFSYDKHASQGTLERIVEVWNDYVVPKFGEQYGLEEAETIDGCVKPDGSPIDLDLKMDIIYPSHPKNKVPLFMLASSSENRIKSTLTQNRPHFIGFLMRGYAAVNYDHEYIPMARDDHYGYFQPYGLQGWNGVKTQTAAVRCARYYADELGYDKENVGVWGHSKSSFCVILSER